MQGHLPDGYQLVTTENQTQRLTAIQPNQQHILLFGNNNQDPNDENSTTDQQLNNELVRHSEQLQNLFKNSLNDIKDLPENNPAAFKNLQLPLARIKKIMRSDEDVRMISAEAPVLFSKACELFIKDLTFRAWFYTKINKRKT